jgi:hypothetical protein
MALMHRGGEWHIMSDILTAPGVHALAALGPSA